MNRISDLHSVSHELFQHKYIFNLSTFNLNINRWLVTLTDQLFTMQTVSLSHFLDCLTYIESNWGHPLYYLGACRTAHTSRVTTSYLSTQRHATHWASFKDCVT